MKEKLKLLITEVAVFLKPFGFIQKKYSFYKIVHENWEVIEFQKGIKGRQEFTINLGVCSKAIYRFTGKNNEYPDFYDCHWKQRIGFFMDKKRDYWWPIGEETDIATLLNEIKQVLLESAFPQLDINISDDSLIDSFFQKKSSGITVLERYMYLTILLKLRGRKELQEIASEMRAFGKGKSYEIAVLEHLKELGIKE